MTASTSPTSLPPDPPVFKSNTLVQFAVGAWMVFVQHLVQRLIGFDGLETGRALMIGNLMPALKVLLSTFGGMRLGIGSTPPVLLLDSGRRRDLHVVDSLDSKAAAGFYSRTHTDFNYREATVMGTFLLSGCLVLAILAGAWITWTRISVTQVTNDAETSIHSSLSIPKNFCPSAEEGSKVETRNVDSAGKDNARTQRRGDPAGHRHSEPHGDESKDNRAHDPNDDSDDDDPSPPPGPGSGLYDNHSSNGGGNVGWKNLGVTFALGCLVAAISKLLQKWKSKTGVPRRRTGFEVNKEHIGGTAYGKEWDVLEGTYGSFCSKSNVDVASRPNTNPRPMVGAVSFTEAAQNQTIPEFAPRNPGQQYVWAGVSKIKAAVKKARAQFGLTQSVVAIQICLESFLHAFGLVDFAVLVVLPLIISVLSDRFNKLDDAGVVVGGVGGGGGCGRQEPDYPLTEANDAQWRPNRREDFEDFVYLDQRASASPNESANQDNPEHDNISIHWASPRRSIERYATHYSKLADFIVRHDACNLSDPNGDYEKGVESITGEVDSSEEGINAELDTTWMIVKDYADKMVTGPGSGSGNIGEEIHTTDEWSSGQVFDRSRDSVTGEFEDTQELHEDFSDVESYYGTAWGSDIEMEENELDDKRVWDKEAGTESQSCSDQENVRCIDDSYTEDELDDPIRLVPGSFPVTLREVPIWGMRSNRRSIFAQFDELREGEPRFASKAIDFCLPRSNTSLQRTPPQASTKTLSSTPPAYPEEET